ncbi:non-ribosomal peptide synthetase [Streptomyces sp. NBC_01429]|uniref:non-ribosomal peptide synthetase n=1 Tax=Streptomyces sp. NBC_01429 TaxID=2903862 RepID=UPI002E2A6137|nr:amino acid adenylation domain-containing protein [Streptomyces sp. NBC_01429]
MTLSSALALPLSESQQGLLVIDRLIPVGHLYNGVFELELTPGHSPERVRETLAAVVAVQPALRQVFRVLPQPHGVLAEPPSAAELPYEDVPDTSSQALRDAVARMGAHTWDVEQGPLYRFVYLHSPERAVLLMVVHHLVFDAVSVHPFVRDLEASLAGLLEEAGRAESRARREADLIREAAAHARLAGEAATAELARVWARELAERPATVLNPRPRRAVETSFTGARVEWELDERESAAVAQVCRRLGVSAYEFFLAVYGAVVARHAATSSVVIGSPMMSRRTVGSFDLCGFFVNTLPVAFDVDWTRSFSSYTREAVRSAVGVARSRIRVAFNQIVEHVRPDRSGNRNPVFSCMLAMQDDITPAPGGAVTSVREHGNGTAKFDLWLGVTPVGGRWRLELEHDTELLPEPVARALVDSLRTALARAGADPDRALADLFLDASLAESRKDDGRRVSRTAPTLTGWVRRTALERPDAVALSWPGGELTYRELECRTAQAVRTLRGRGVEPGDVVGVGAGGFVDTIVAILGVLGAGAAYLPFDTGLPEERIRYMLEQADCSLVIGGSAAGRGVRNVEASELARGADAEPGVLPAADPDRPVYVMFSSGSTGRPKGIEMTEGALLNLVSWQIDAFGMNGRTRFLQYAPLGFDVSFQELLPTLAAGGTVISREPADRRDFPALVERLRESGVTHVYLPVAALRPFVQAAQSADAVLAELRKVCVSGEQLLVDDEIRAFFRSRPQLELINLYGPTETHAVTTHRLAGGDARWPTHVAIGIPLSGVRAYVVDVTGHLAPAGVQGELCLGGACPARGYRNAPELTARSFRKDPYAEGDGRMYRTGDQVLRDEHGLLQFLGRTDEQVKIRGYRVELGEIEAVAHGTGEVGRAVAAVREGGAGRELVLFTLSEGVDDQSRLRELLMGRLPDYMVPRWILPVDAIPVTANGKVDRAALLRGAETAIADRLAAAERVRVCNADSLEEELASLWSELLASPALDREVSLLDNGAHSLMILTALSRVRQRYGVEISLRKFFHTPTIAALADAVRGGLPAER